MPSAFFYVVGFIASRSVPQECSMDIRKEMSRSIFLAGGVTQLPGFAERLTTEMDNLTPPAIRPKVTQHDISSSTWHCAADILLICLYISLIMLRCKISVCDHY